MHLIVTRLEVISTFAACSVADICIATYFLIDMKQKLTLFRTTQYILAIAAIVSCGILFATSPLEAQLRRFASINSLRALSSLCTCMEPVRLCYHLNQTGSIRATTIFWFSLLSTLLLLGVGAWRYVTTGSQWLWLFIQMPSAMPSTMAFALSIKLKLKKKQTQCRLLWVEGWVAVPNLIAIALAVAACIVPNTRVPALHGVQFPGQFALGLLQTVARVIRKELFPTQQRPSDSRENLVERTEAQELENLEPQTQSHFDTD